MPDELKVYAIVENWGDGYTFGCSEVHSLYMDKDVAEYIVDAVNEKAEYGAKGGDCHNVSVSMFKVSNISGINSASKVVRELVKKIKRI